MKKLLLVLLALPLLGFGQTAEEYFNKAEDYVENEQYQLAIDNYTSAIKINPDYAKAYNNRGSAYANLENYKAAIADYTSAIRINPDFASAYKNRGLAKKNTGQSYCSDYKRACDLGDNECCKWYKEDNCR